MVAEVRKRKMRRGSRGSIGEKNNAQQGIAEIACPKRNIPGTVPDLAWSPFSSRFVVDGLISGQSRSSLRRAVSARKQGREAMVACARGVERHPFAARAVLRCYDNQKPKKGFPTMRGRLAQLVRAPALQAGCPGFESLTAHQIFPIFLEIKQIGFWMLLCFHGTPSHPGACSRQPNRCKTDCFSRPAEDSIWSRQPDRSFPSDARHFSQAAKERRARPHHGATGTAIIGTVLARRSASIPNLLRRLEHLLRNSRQNHKGNSSCYTSDARACYELSCPRESS